MRYVYEPGTRHATTRQPLICSRGSIPVQAATEIRNWSDALQT